VRGDDLAGHGQADPLATDGVALIGTAVVAVEDPLELIAGDAGSAIGHREHDLVLGSIDLDVQLLVRRRELDGVAEQVLDDLLDAAAIRTDRERTAPDGIHVDPSPRNEGNATAGLFRFVEQVDVVELESHARRSGRPKEVRDEPVQLLHLLLHRLQVA